MKYNRSEIMKKAWNIFRSTKKSFSEALKKAWWHAKADAACVVKEHRIPDWFMDKNYDKVTTDHCYAWPCFTDKDIERETEKAILVKLELHSKRTGEETRYSKNVWVPKSIVIWA